MGRDSHCEAEGEAVAQGAVVLLTGERELWSLERDVSELILYVGGEAG